MIIVLVHHCRPCVWLTLRRVPQSFVVYFVLNRWSVTASQNRWSAAKAKDALIWARSQATCQTSTIPILDVSVGRRGVVGIRQPHGSTRIRLPRAHAFPLLRPPLSVAKREIRRSDDSTQSQPTSSMTISLVRNATRMEESLKKSRLKQSTEAPRSGVLHSILPAPHAPNGAIAKHGSLERTMSPPTGSVLVSCCIHPSFTCQTHCPVMP